MRYGSVCSGIEAASTAWHHMGWEPAFFSEIEPFPRAVLQHHWPEVPLHGDFTTIGANDYGTIDLLVGGTPCQSFSIAGLRKGMDDHRGNLALEFCKLIDRKRPTWVLWENVPGCLSTNGGRDFGSLLGAMGELGYGFAYRVLDAQYFGVPQRRRRVFLVANTGGWEAAAAVLFERESLLRNPPPSREAREEVAGTLDARARSGGFPGTDGACSGHIVPDVVGTLDTQCGFQNQTHQTIDNGQLIPETTGTLTARMMNALGARDIEEGAVLPVAFDAYNQEDTGHVSKTVASRNDQDTASLVLPINDKATRQKAGNGLGIGKSGDPCPTLTSGDRHAVAFAENSRGEVRLESGDGQTTGAVTSGGGKPGQGYPAVSDSMAVRKLTPVECERLQGFPDNHTQIPWRNKAPEDCPDGPRYKAIGNSMAVPVMKWIGERIKQVQEIQDAGTNTNS